MSEPKRLPAAHRIAPGIFYGWIVTAGASLLAFVSVGIGFYGTVVFLDALCQVHGWSKSSVSGATSLYFIVSGLAGTVIGRSVDRHGARGWILAGAVLMAGALVALGRVDAVWQLYLVYPLMALGFAMCGGVPANAIITRWFVVRRARAMSFSQTGVSVGGVVLVPVSVGLIASRGLGDASMFLAMLVLAVALPITVFVLRFDPRPFGLLPDGRPQGEGDNPLLAPARQLRRWSTREVLATRSFWGLAGAFAGILFVQQGALLHQLAFVRERLDVGAAAFAVSTTAFGSIVARLAVGLFADRIEKRHLAVALVALQAATLVAFTFSAGALPLYLCSLVIGFTVGNLFMLQSLLTSELFGQASFGKVFGTLTLITQVVGGCGPYALGLLYESFGGYELPFRGLVVIELAAGWLLWRVAPPGEPREPPTENDIDFQFHPR